MMPRTIRSVALLAGMVAFATVGSGCYADADGPRYAQGYQGDDPQEAQQEQAEAPQPQYGQAPQPDYAQGAEPRYVVETYQPQYYGGYVVYYDGVGRPFYSNGGGYSYIPTDSPYYAGYVGHYRTYAPAYRRWYSGGGYRYPTYHGGMGHGVRGGMGHGVRTGGGVGHGVRSGGGRGVRSGGGRGGHHR